MRRRSILAASLALLMLGSLTVPANKAKAVTGKIVLGYYNVYYSGDTQSYNSVSSYGSYFNSMSTMTFHADASGNITGTAPSSAITLAASKGIQSFAAVTNQANGAFSSSVAHAIVSDPAVRTNAVNRILSTAKANGYQGVNIDFEDMLASDRPYFNQFISELSSVMRANGLKTIVSVIAKTSDMPTSAWSGVYDYHTLGQYADLIQIMTYDQNGPWGAPGPVAGLPWVDSVLKYAVTQIPSSKIMMGLPAYGYDWNTTTNTGHKAVAWKNVPALLTNNAASVKWDSVQQSPYATYTAADGTSHTIWYENADSIQAKTRLAGTYNLAGVSMWCLRLEDESFWKAVQAGLGTTASTTSPTPSTTTTSTSPTTSTTTTSTSPTTSTTTTSTSPTTSTTTTSTSPTTSTTTTSTSPTTSTTTTTTSPMTSTTTLTPSKSAYAAGETVYVTAKVTDSSGKGVYGASVTLSVTSPTGAVTKYTGTTDSTGVKKFVIYTSKKTVKGTYKAQAVTPASTKIATSSAAASYIIK
ncbi:glycosyl hydrolase family 18 protein [Paenibacillus mucilaginosus]|uniref:Glycosyl hydrolase, family 18 domain protein, putative n=1 Tax=Paenibacillus mucilaginosus (strain KNP414) TaxID=1036673 RepID=F8FHH4_PAEMK|nr:glycosyl hydrolase family 18 protein [Paenibacillus mucilaginosus]AEI42282.1 glycosyl hydrolase, family 18 domain protein, putative [Paenibacillus mucilaginosus KNP414]MCG7214243.1 glycosyl hydrolase family 18 protein [Paenibacillus mucilaginosus]WDM28755.1 glycosyl hydrolase [Paenibacillus mucilaginosus]